MDVCNALLGKREKLHSYDWEYNKPPIYRTEFIRCVRPKHWRFSRHQRPDGTRTYQTIWEQPND